jgi:mono/diheme cytochrome c family protein
MPIRVLALALVALALPGLWVSQPKAREASVDRAAGRALAEQHCARSHAIGRKSASPFAKATPFRDIHRKYRVDDLEEAFGEGTTGNHLGMPDFAFSPRQVMDLLGYIKSLEGRRKAR